jgi:hypothetical protein
VGIIQKITHEIGNWGYCLNKKIHNKQVYKKSTFNIISQRSWATRFGGRVGQYWCALIGLHQICNYWYGVMKKKEELAKTNVDFGLLALDHFFEVPSVNY